MVERLFRIIEACKHKIFVAMWRSCVIKYYGEGFRHKLRRDEGMCKASHARIIQLTRIPLNYLHSIPSIISFLYSLYYSGFIDEFHVTLEKVLS